MTNEIIKQFTSQDVCDIIESCVKHGVSKFKFGQFHLEFGKPTNPPQVGQANPPDPRPEEFTVAEQQEATVKLTEEQELEMRNEQIKMATIENPGLAEQLLIDGDLEDDDDDIEPGVNDY